MSETDDELLALLALDALEPGEQADAELRHGVFPAAVRASSAALAEAAAAPPPGALREGVLAAALRRRPPGRPVGAIDACSPAEAYARTIAEFRSLLDSLTPADWERPAHADHGRVRDVVAHLAGIERLVLRWLDPDDDVPPMPDHIAAGAPMVAALAPVATAELVEEWHSAARAVLAATQDADPRRQIVFHDGVATPKVLVVIRVFELWAHQTDIARAVGRPAPDLDPERMAVMSQMLMSLVPFALAYRGVAQPGRAARFVLTGAAGGAYPVPLSPGEAAGEPEVTITAGVVDVCRVAANRLAPADLAVAVDGDRDLADLVLAGLDAFARD